MCKEQIERESGGLGQAPCLQMDWWMNSWYLEHLAANYRDSWRNTTPPLIPSKIWDFYAQRLIAAKKMEAEFSEKTSCGAKTSCVRDINHGWWRLWSIKVTHKGIILWLCSLSMHSQSSSRTKDGTGMRFRCLCSSLIEIWGSSDLQCHVCIPGKVSGSR